MTDPRTRPMTRMAARMCFGETGLTRLDAGACPSCGHADARKTIRDHLSETEFAISGLCQACQDRTFGASEED